LCHRAGLLFLFQMASSPLEPLVGGYLVLRPDISPDTVFMSFLTNSHGHFSPNRIINLRAAGYHPYGPGYRCAHMGYVTVPWSENAATREASVRDVELGSEIAAWLGFSGIVVHLPRAYHHSPQFDDAMSDLFRVCDERCEIYLENVTGWGSTYPPLSTLSEMVSRIPSMPNPRGVRWSLCVDTAHLFAQGVRMSSEEEGMRLVTELRKLPVGLVHLNGSSEERSSGKDHHAELCSSTDLIWGRDDAGLRVLVREMTERRIPMILERPGRTVEKEYQDEIALVRSLVS
jgi:endonuclease IV